MVEKYSVTILGSQIEMVKKLCLAKVNRTFAKYPCFVDFNVGIIIMDHPCIHDKSSWYLLCYCDLRVQMKVLKPSVRSLGRELQRFHSTYVCSWVSELFLL